MRLAYLTSRFPFAHIGETFLDSEARLLAGLCEQVHVIPARPQHRAGAFGRFGTIDVYMEPLGVQTAFYAIIEALLHPVLAARAFGRIALPRYAARAKLKNVFLFPKALAVARYVRKHRIDHIHAHWMTTSSTIGYVASAMTGIPWSCTAHAHDIFSDNLLKQKARSARFLRFIAHRNLQHFVEVTGCDTSRLRVVHLGVDIPSSAASTVADRPLRIICPARLDPIKGHEYLLRALALLRDRGLPFHCEIVGNGELFDQLKARICNLGLEAFVRLRGLVEHRILLEELQAGGYDVLVLPSLELEARGKHEGIPVAMIEAMAAGVPCIATSTGCIPELVTQTTGLLVPQRNPERLAQALERLASDRALARTLGLAARKRVTDEFDAVKTTNALYDLICAGVPRGVNEGQPSPLPLTTPVNIPAANAN